MKARAFDYLRAPSIESAIAAFQQCGGEARYLAGGQSLLAALNLRLDAPDLLIDIAHIPTLKGIGLDGDMLRIGALTKHAEVLDSPLVARHAPLLSAAAAYVAHPAIRNKGTMGGSLALADPASEFPAVSLCLDASIEITGRNGVRLVKAHDFFLGLYETALAPGEIVSALLIPVIKPGQFTYFHELARRRGDYAIAGLASQATFKGATVEAISLSFFSVGPTAVRARQAERTLAGGPLNDETIAAARTSLAADLEPEDDAQILGATRSHLASVLLKRALASLQLQSRGAEVPE